MMTSSRSTVRIRSRITRYWLIGTSSEFELLRPFLQPCLLDRRDLVLERGQRAVRLRLPLAADLLDQRVDHQGRVADERMIGAVVLVDVARRRWSNG